MSDFKLYSGTYCPFCKMVEKFIKENDLEDKVPVVLIDKDQEALNALIEGGGKRQVPCLYHQGQWMYESQDIMEFLREKFL